MGVSTSVNFGVGIPAYKLKNKYRHKTQDDYNCTSDLEVISLDAAFWLPAGVLSLPN